MSIGYAYAGAWRDAAVVIETMPTVDACERVLIAEHLRGIADAYEARAGVGSCLTYAATKMRLEMHRALDAWLGQVEAKQPDGEMGEDAEDPATEDLGVEMNLDTALTRCALVRMRRQKAVGLWVRDTFGAEVMEPVERAARLLEEALELAQAAGLGDEDAMALLHHVYAKPKGDIRQEAGGVGVTLLAFCEAVGIDGDLAESDEFDRASNKPRDEMRQRHQVKVDAGVAAPMRKP